MCGNTVHVSLINSQLGEQRDIHARLSQWKSTNLFLGVLKARCHGEYLVSLCCTCFSSPPFYRKPRCLLEDLLAAELRSGADAV